MPNNPFFDRKRILDTLYERHIKRKPIRSSLITCDVCRFESKRETLAETKFVCPKCGAHLRFPVKERFSALFDGGEYEELFKEILPFDPIKFPGYASKISEQQSKSGLSGACLAASGQIGTYAVICAAIDIGFMMGSMGAAVGEKITRAFELATEEGLPVVGFTVSGGARMQEGLISLMQMAKTAAAVQRHSAAGLLYLTVLTNPTTGGVTASFAMLGDVIFAEPGATVGFAGARVIEQTVGKKLPQGFQTAEFLLAHGFADAIVPRDEQRWAIGNMLKLHAVSA